jgi:G:T-mismatch repair DNA endonuclease (very short patch repair protein)
MLVVIAKPHIEFVTEQYFLCRRGLNGDRYSASTHRLAWTVITVWECELGKNTDATIDRIEADLRAAKDKYDK